MTLLRACLDRRVLAALAATAVLIAIVAPQLITAAIPLLVVAACPLSMIVMMATMRHADAGASPTGARGANEVRAELAELERRRSVLEDELASPQAAGSAGTRGGRSLAPQRTRPESGAQRAPEEWPERVRE